MTRHAAAINGMNGTPQAVFLWMFTALVRNDPQEQDSRHAVIRNQQVNSPSPLTTGERCPMFIKCTCRRVLHREFDTLTDTLRSGRPCDLWTPLEAKGRDPPRNRQFWTRAGATGRPECSLLIRVSLVRSQRGPPIESTSCRDSAMRRYGSCQHYVSSSHPVGAACACYAPGRTNQIGFLSINAVACVMPLGDYKSRILFRTCNLFTLLINDGPETTRITGHDSRHAEVVPPFLRSEYDRASTEAVVHVRVKEDCEDRTTQRICGDDSALHKRKRETRLRCWPPLVHPNGNPKK